MSAESGIATFRDMASGLWARFDPAQLATPEAWEHDPARVWAWYQWRAGLVCNTSPNAGHLALARWQDARPGVVSIATQNVDDLHERAGSPVASHVHGSLFAPRCSRFGTPYEGAVDYPDEPVEHLDPPHCPDCGALVRPGIVWFGEMLPEDQWDVAEAAAATANVVLVVGTSGVVYPFAGLPELARRAGAYVVEINPEPTEISEVAHQVWRATAGEALPGLVGRVLESAP